MPNWFRVFITVVSLVGLFIAWRWQVDLEPAKPLVTVGVSFLAGILFAHAIAGKDTQ